MVDLPTQPQYKRLDPAGPYKPLVVEQYAIAGWSPEGAGGKLTFPVLSIDEEGGNRIVEHERPYREGSKLDDTGAKATVWVLEALFNNTVVEDGLGPDPLYPVVLNQVIRSFALHGTGTLYLPTRGAVRARADRYRRKDTGETPDSVQATLIFKEDNEDAVDRGALKEPTVRATLVRQEQQTRFSNNALGELSSFSTELQALCEGLQDLMQAPGRSVDDITRQIERINHSVERTIRVSQEEGRRVGGLMSDPQGSDAERQLRRLLGTVTRAANEKNASRPRTRRHAVQTDTNIYAVASGLRQNPDLLIDLNALADPSFIEAGTVIRVFV